MLLQMTRKKVLLTTGALILTFVVIVAVGISMIKNSGAYFVAQMELARYLNGNTEQSRTSSKFAWWRSWSYNESASNGNAFFTLCTVSSNVKCYVVQLKKDFEVWRIVSIKERS
jgi:hypothetical protein